MGELDNCRLPGDVFLALAVRVRSHSFTGDSVRLRSGFTRAN